MSLSRLIPDATSFSLVRARNPWILALAFVCWTASLKVTEAAQDTVVVFNELHYHPATEDGSGEWVELHNQLGVNVDMSGWALTGGISFAFPEGTVIPGGGFLVVTDSATPAAGQFGPFSGSLANGGERLVLRDNSKRPLSILDYGDSGAWPVEADGSGFTLAKKDPNSLPSDPGNWTWSAQPGGTPAAHNFPEGTPARTIVFNEHAAPDDAGFFLELTNTGPQAIDLAGARLLHSASTEEYTLPALVIEPDGYVFLSRATLPFTTISAGDRFFLLTPDRASLTAGLRLDAVASGRHPDGVGEWMFPERKTEGGANAFSISADIVINEIMYHFPPQYAETGVPDVLSPRTFLGVDETWRYESSGTELDAAWKDPGFDDSAWASGAGLIGFETSVLAAPLLTEIERAGQVTIYARKSIDYAGNLKAPATLRLLVDDGAIIYVNGNEVARVRMPAGAVNQATTATDSNEATEYEAIVVDPNPFQPGTNVIAVEVHNSSPGSSDLVFGLEIDDQVIEKPGVPDIPYQERDEEWIELYNRGAQEIDLTGWEIRGGIGFDFPAGTVVPAGGFLVVSNDAAALRGKWPDAVIIGDFTGGLDNGGDRIRLKDGNENVVDEVHYYDGGSWSDKADGGGSSLELMDPDADNANGGAWAGSDESGKSEWVDIVYNGVSERVAGTSPPTQWNEFILGMLDAGEILLDDISVVEEPFGAAEERMQNSGFTTGAETWRLLGTHGVHGRTRVVDDPAAPGNPVLHLVSTGGTDHKHDHIETTFADRVRVKSNAEYRISYRAKWLSGSPQVNTRIYFFHLARTTILPIPENLGTPGAPNSSRVENMGPVFSGFQHSPVIPSAGEPVHVSVSALDTDGVEGMTLKWLVDAAGATFKDVAMTRNAETGLWEATIPGQSEGDLLHVWVEGRDALGAVATWPRDGAEARALIRVNDGYALDGPAYNVRVLMRDADADLLHEVTNVMSNHRIKGTLVFNERDVYYNVGIRLKGSQRGRNQTSRVGFNVGFPADNKFRGLQSTIAIDRSGSGNEYSQKEILVKHAVTRAGNIPGMYDDLIHVIAPRRQHNGGAIMLMQRYGDEFLEGMYENGSRGHVFEYELIYFPTSTTGGTEGLKRPEPDSVTGVNINQLGDGTNKEHYRWYILKKNNSAADSYSEIMEFMRVMGLSPGSDEYKARIGDVIDIDEWLRAMAIQVLFGTGDNYAYGAQHNGIFYVRPSDKRTLYFPWDMDFTFSSGMPTNMSPNGDLSNLLRDPVNKRAYFGHLDDIVKTTFNGDYFDPWVEHYNSYLTRKDLATYGRTIRSNSTAARRNIDRAYPQEEFAITTNGGNAFTVDEPVAGLEGTGWINVRSVRLAGMADPLPLTWSEDGDRWQVQVPLSTGANTITLEALDFQGSPGTAQEPVGTDSIVITSTAAIEPAGAANLVVAEIMYHPAAPSAAEVAAGFDDQDDFEFIELVNIGAQAIDLRGVRFTAGVDYEFAAAAVTELAPGARLVLASNAAAFATRYGQDADGDYSGRLANGGETLRINGINGVIKEFTYGDRAPWPEAGDGEGYSLVLQGFMGNPDPNEPGNWNASVQRNGTPGTDEVAGITLTQWLAANAIESPETDTNGDGVPAIFDFAFGADLTEAPARALLPQAVLIQSGEDAFPAFSFRSRNGALGITYEVEVSEDLSQWKNADSLIEVSSLDNGDGTTTVLLRSAQQAASSTSVYYRLKVQAD